MDEPVFLVGPARSGSSFMLEALRKAADFVGFTEGHAGPMFSGLSKSVQDYYAGQRYFGMLDMHETAIANLPEAKVQSAVDEVYRSFIRGAFGDNRWIDKTASVEGIEALPYLLRLWPKAKIINLRRDGVDTVTSTERYFGVSFEIACQNWRNCGQAWDRIAAQIPRESWITVSHEGLVSDPARQGGLIADHLGLPDGRRARLLDHLATKTAQWRAANAPIAINQKLHWPKADIFSFFTVCGPQMLQQGYCSQEEVDGFLSGNAPGGRPVEPGAFHAVSSESPGYFKVMNGSVYIHAGDKSATTALCRSLDVSGAKALTATLAVEHAQAKAIRLELLGIDGETGAVALSFARDLRALEPVEIAAPIKPGTKSLDLFIRAVRGAATANNFFGWVKMDGLRLDVDA